LDLISSIACRLVGSADARNSRLPRLNSGSNPVLGEQLVGDHGARRFQVDAERVEVEQRHAVFGRREWMANVCAT